jgi:uncharacterized Tic20 family protein
MAETDPPQDPVPPQQPPAPAMPVVATEERGGVSGDERQWAMLAHLSALLGYIVTSGWAGSAGGFLGPLIVWMMKKDTMPFVDQQAKEALNFSITICIAFATLWMFGIMTLGIGFLIALPLMLVVGLYALVYTIIASMKAYEGVPYRYPIALRPIK